MNLATFSPVLFFAAAFTLATILGPVWSNNPRSQAKSVMDMLVGDGKRLFANHFVVKADVYFHNGYYPSIFQQAKADSHLTESAEEHSGVSHEEVEEGHSSPTSEKHETDHSKETPEEHAKHAGLSNEPHDFLEAFGRHFFISQHSHMKNADARELLPWFKISAELDPSRVETYTVAAFWLRTQLGKVNEAEEFLREGWKANPQAYPIIYELGRLYETDRKDNVRARNLFELALKKWDQQEKPKEKPDVLALEQILGHLVDTEYKLKDYRACLRHLERLEPLSPYPEAIRKQIREVQQKLQGT